MNKQQRVAALNAEARRLGIQLPMTAEEIISWEEQVHVVDLETGNVQWLQANRPVPVWEAKLLVPESVAKLLGDDL